MTIFFQVPPAGPPVVVPAGKMLSNGTIALLSDTSVPGVSWESDNFRVFDNNTVLDKSVGTLHKGHFINVTGST